MSIQGHTGEKLGSNTIYSFTVEDDIFAVTIAEQLFNIQKEDKTFTYEHLETRRQGHIFRIRMFGKVSEDLKKVLFKAGLKVKSGIKTR